MPDFLLTKQEAIVQQVFKPVGNEYRISVPLPGSAEEARPLLFVKQKKMKIREDIRFRLSPDDDTHVFMIKGKTVFEFRGRHDVLDAQDNPIGVLEKTFGRSLLRSHWRIRDPEGNELLDAQELNLIVALVRRFAGLLPDWLSLLSWIPFNFEIRRDGKQVRRRASRSSGRGATATRSSSVRSSARSLTAKIALARRLHRCLGGSLPGPLALQREIGVEEARVSSGGVLRCSPSTPTSTTPGVRRRARPSSVNSARP